GADPEGYLIHGHGPVVGSGQFFRVAGAGDVVGDTRPDVMISGTPIENGRPNSGVTHVVPGKASGTAQFLDAPATGSLRIDGAAPDDLSGTGIDGVGDVNGDGRGDVLVSAPEADGGGDDAGATYVVFGKQSPEMPVDLNRIGLDGARIDGAVAG